MILAEYFYIDDLFKHFCLFQVSVVSVARLTDFRLAIEAVLRSRVEMLRQAIPAVSRRAAVAEARVYGDVSADLAADLIETASQDEFLLVLSLYCQMVEVLGQRGTLEAFADRNSLPTPPMLDAVQRISVAHVRSIYKGASTHSTLTKSIDCLERLVINLSVLALLLLVALDVAINPF